ncbi:MAG: uroporphyrinogen decarboxylase family protein [Anaerolineae bacterium]
MNHRERALAAMRGQPVDRIPFLARMDLWYGFHHSRGTLPAPYERAGPWDILRDLDIGIVGSWADWGDLESSFYRLVPEGVEVTIRQLNGLTLTRWETPFGALTCRDDVTAEVTGAAGTGIRVEYPFKGVQDYDALCFLIEHTRVVENYAAYGCFLEAIGDDGVALPFSGYLPAHQVLLRLMGCETFYYELFDHPTQMQRLIDALTAQQREILALAAASPAQIVEVGGNYDEQVTPPRFFEEYLMPFYREARCTLEAADKILVVHGDSEMRGLLTSLRDCGVQVVESLTPQPMTSIDVAATRRLWGDRVVMWGGIASIMLTDVYSDDDFETYLGALFEAVKPGDRFILGFGDNVPTNGLLSRIVQAGRFWQAHGQCPLS